MHVTGNGNHYPLRAFCPKSDLRIFLRSFLEVSSNARQHKAKFVATFGQRTRRHPSSQALHDLRHDR